MARPGIEPRTSDLRIRGPIDCAMRPGTDIEQLPLEIMFYQSTGNPPGRRRYFLIGKNSIIIIFSVVVGWSERVELSEFRLSLTSLFNNICQRL